MSGAVGSQARRNLAVLVCSQSLLFTNNSVLVAVTGLAGLKIAPVPAMATVPVTCYVVGGAVASMPVALAMKRWGRRPGFLFGTLCGMAGAGICALALWHSLFLLFCLGTFVLGAYFAAGQQYRFAAAEAAGPDLRSRAISWVLAGGLVGGVLGPETTRHTRDLLEGHTYVGSYLSLIGFAMLAASILAWLNMPRLSAAERAQTGRPLGTIMRTPVFIVAALSAAVSYGVMNLLMTATPLAMTLCTLPFDDVAWVIEWHLVGMFAPAFFTGSLVRRYGVLPIIGCGVVLMAACVGVALSGQDVSRFWGALVLLGVGWNFMYVGATTLLTEAGAPSERAKIQGANDFLVFAAMSVSSLSSGALVSLAGWQAMNLGAVPFLILVALAITWLGVLRQRSPTPG